MHLLIGGGLITGANLLVLAYSSKLPIKPTDSPQLSEQLA
jgi:hypothetical protein